MRLGCSERADAGTDRSRDLAQVLLDLPTPLKLDDSPHRCLLRSRSGDLYGGGEPAEGREGLASEPEREDRREVRERAQLGRVMLQSCKEEASVSLSLGKV